MNREKLPPSLSNFNQSNSNNNDLKHEIRSLFLKNRKWSNCAVQLSLPYYDDQSTMLDKIFELKIHFFLSDLYDLIFIKKRPCLHVFFAVHETLSELNVQRGFTECITNPVVMMLKSIEAHDKQVEHESSIKDFQSLTFNLLWKPTI